MHTDATTDSPKRLFIQSRDRDEAQSFLSRCVNPMHVASASDEPFDFEAKAVNCGGLSFGLVNSNSGIEMDMVERYDGYSMKFQTSGSMVFNTGGSSPLASRADSGLVVDLQEVRRATFSLNSEWHRIALSSEDLHNHITMLTEQPTVQRVKFKPHFDSNSGFARTIFGVSQAIISGTRGKAPLLSAPVAIASLRDAVLSMFIEGVPHSYSHHLNQRVALPATKNVRRAIDFMQANVTKPLQLEDIARAAQTSPRSLQTAFRNFRNVTPMEYLRRLRLDGARNDLIHGLPGTIVSEVAYRWGFAHHGLFSANYAKAFGELPSVTLRRGTIWP